VPPPPLHRVRRLSYSALALFERCSYRYYAERVAGLRERRGSVRLLVIAGGDHDRLAVARWLMDAQAAGADVGLVTDSPADAAGGLHVRELERLTPLRLIRALDAEVQLRGVDALVPWGRRERRLAQLLPPELRAPYGPLDPKTDPAQAERLVRAATR